MRTERESEPASRELLELMLVAARTRVDTAEAPFMRAWNPAVLTGGGLVVTIMISAVRDQTHLLPGVNLVVDAILILWVGLLSLSILVQVPKRDRVLVQAKEEVRLLEVKLAQMLRAEAKRASEED